MRFFATLRMTKGNVQNDTGKGNVILSPIPSHKTGWNEESKRNGGGRDSFPSRSVKRDGTQNDNGKELTKGLQSLIPGSSHELLLCFKKISISFDI